MSNGNYRKNRFEINILRSLAILINESVVNEKVGIITLTEVKVTTNTNQAQCYFMVLSTDPIIIKLAQGLLEKAASNLKKKLAMQMKNQRIIPDLIFIYDDALAYGNKIEGILSKIREE